MDRNLEHNPMQKNCFIVTNFFNTYRSDICFRILHSGAKFKIVSVRKPERIFYYFIAKFQGSSFSFQSLDQKYKVVIFRSLYVVYTYILYIFFSCMFINFKGQWKFSYFDTTNPSTFNNDMLIFSTVLSVCR